MMKLRKTWSHIYKKICGDFASVFLVFCANLCDVKMQICWFCSTSFTIFFLLVILLFRTKLRIFFVGDGGICTFSIFSKRFLIMFWTPHEYKSSVLANTIILLLIGFGFFVGEHTNILNKYFMDVHSYLPRSLHGWHKYQQHN